MSNNFASRYGRLFFGVPCRIQIAPPRSFGQPYGFWLGLFLVFFSFSSFAEVPSDPNVILINHVRLVNQKGKAEDQTVNILIINKHLDTVTKEDIPPEKADLFLDARNGVLVGFLDIGKPCNFLILDQDPKENFEVLLDTKRHVVLALHQGEIVKNNLIREVLQGPAPSKHPKKGLWFAYMPPPVALPVFYQKADKWNQFENDYFSSTFLGVLALDRQFWLSQDDQSKQQVGDLKDSEGGEIRGLRFGAVGMIKFENPWIYTISGTTNTFDKGFESDEDDSFSLLDWRLDIPLEWDMTLAVGKQKEPISMERNMGLIYLPWQERSAVNDAMLPSRNIGAVLSGGALEERMSWALGMFNDWLDSGQSYNESDTQFISRVTGLAYLSEDETRLVHLGLGARYSDAKEGLRYFARPEFNPSPIFVDTGTFDADNSMTYNLEAAWRSGPLWISGEYILNDVDSSSAGDPTFKGYQVSASYILTGEMRPYNKRSGVFSPVPVSKSVNKEGWGALELATRFSSLDLTDGGVDGGQMDIYSLGLNWWLTRTASFGINYRHIEQDHFDTEGSSDGLVTRLTLILE